jgi:hypothetical protein
MSLHWTEEERKFFWRHIKWAWMPTRDWRMRSLLPFWKSWFKIFLSLYVFCVGWQSRVVSLAALYLTCPQWWGLLTHLGGLHRVGYIPWSYGTTHYHHHKFHGSQFGNNNHVKSIFHKFVWNRHECHSFIYIAWTSMYVHYLDTNVIFLFVLFKHWCYMSIHVVYTWKLCTWLSCLNNAQHSCLNNTNLWNNRFYTNLKWTHEACKFFVMTNLNK